MRRVAVTGGTGFIGRHLVRRLQRDGICVVAPSRRQANLDDRGALAREFEGSEVVFHLAARVTEWGSRSLFRHVNVDGTRNELEAARAAGVPRVVHVSSDTVYGYPCPHANTTEETPSTSRILDSNTWSKIEAPEVAAAAQAGHFVIVKHGERSERIPLTVADFDRERGTIAMVIQAVGKTTKELQRLREGDCLDAFVGPLGAARHFEKRSKVVLVRGGPCRGAEHAQVPGDRVTRVHVHPKRTTTGAKAR